MSKTPSVEEVKAAVAEMLRDIRSSAPEMVASVPPEDRLKMSEALKAFAEGFRGVVAEFERLAEELAR